MTGISIAAALAALVAAAFAYWHARAARLALARMQPDAGPRRALDVSALDGRVQREASGTTIEYALLASIANREQRERTIATILLRVNYRTRDHLCGAVEIAAATPADDGEHRTGVVGPLSLPIHLEADDRAIGWVNFRTPPIVPRHARVDGYAIVAIDREGRRQSADISLPASAGYEATEPAVSAYES